MSIRPRISGFGFICAVIFGASLPAVPSHAYTQDQQQLCTGDAFRLCSAAIPDVDRVTACMVQNRRLLSPGCAQFFRDVRPTPVGMRKPAVKSRKPKHSRRVS